MALDNVALYIVRLKHTYSRQSLSVENSRMFSGGEPTFAVFTGRAYNLDGESKWVPTPASSQIPYDDDDYEVAPPTVQVLSDDSYEPPSYDRDSYERDSYATSRPTTLPPMNTYLADEFTRAAERIHNCQLMLTSYAAQLQEKRYSDGFLSHLEKLTYHNARNLSLVDSAMHREDTKTMDEVTELCELCDRYAEESEKEFYAFKSNVLTFLADSDTKTMDTKAKRNAYDSEEDAEEDPDDLEKSLFPTKKGRRLRRKTSSSSAYTQED